MNYKNITPVVFVASFIVLGIAIGTISVLFLTNILKYDRYDKQDFIDPNTYQAVFLRNDQIYFGRLNNISSDYLLLKDVYYVKVGEGGAGKLVKLGASETHGPKDEMIINQDQIMFWENLKFDSPVVRGIQNQNK